LADVTRLVLMIAPRGRGSFSRQGEEVLTVMAAMLARLPQPAAFTVQTVFLRDARDQPECKRLFAERYGVNSPVTNFVVQPPCCGAALAVEAWAIGGKSVRLEQFGPETLAVDYEGVRWIYCVVSPPKECAIYTQATNGFYRLRALLHEAGGSFEHVVRTWLYLGGITEPEANTSRYQELNRARTDFYRDIQFGRSLPRMNGVHTTYPASTGIGMHGTDLAMSCIAFKTDREDVFLLPLENPQQTSAYAYDRKYSIQSPKFSRGMALVAGDYVTTWISGTASIVNSESRHAGDLERQTEQTIDNIERLITPENFSNHGLSDAGAALNDLAKIRVYIKRAEDFEKCRTVCERRFGSVPAIYLVADICRPELLVEIEAVAFSKCGGPGKNKG
jgi:enamine deaminase RidA (YjgF/YER057c/UK114 family)